MMTTGMDDWQEQPRRDMNTEQQSQPKISLIAALSENHVIARDGKIPWQLPGDAKRYREKIDGRVIIAGRETFDRTYRNDVSIVLTRKDDYRSPIPATIVHTVSDALRVAREKLADVRAEKRDEIFVIGGGEIFRQTIGTADTLSLTIIHQTVEGDTFFPDYSAFTKTVFEETHKEHGYHYTFLDLERALS
ncbi:MAG: dihydrofolate reductase [Thermomicrobiales bacterium]